MLGVGDKTSGYNVSLFTLPPLWEQMAETLPDQRVRLTLAYHCPRFVRDPCGKVVSTVCTGLQGLATCGKPVEDRRLLHGYRVDSAWKAGGKASNALCSGIRGAELGIGHVWSRARGGAGSTAAGFEGHRTDSDAPAGACHPRAATASQPVPVSSAIAAVFRRLLTLNRPRGSGNRTSPDTGRFGEGLPKIGQRLYNRINR